MEQSQYTGSRVAVYEETKRDLLESHNFIDQVNFDMAASRLVLIRNRPNLSDSDLNRFMSKFGYVRPHCLAAQPVVNLQDLLSHEVRPIANIDLASDPVTTRNYATIWHLEQSYFQQPAKESLLYCVDPSDSDVRTHFCDMQGVYEDLPSWLVEMLEGTEGVYAYRKGRAGKPEIRLERDNESDAVHPMLFTNPRTGRPTIYYSPHKLIRIRGVDADFQAEIAAVVQEIIDSGRHTYSHSWRAGDIVLFDALVMLHKRDAIPGTSPRYMKMLTTIFDFGLLSYLAEQRSAQSARDTSGGAPAPPGG